LDYNGCGFNEKTPGYQQGVIFACGPGKVVGGLGIPAPVLDEGRHRR